MIFCGNFKYHAGILTPVSFSYALILRPPLKKYPHLLETQIVLASGLQIHSILFFYILQQYFYKKISEYQEKYKYCFQYHNIRTKKDCQLSFLSYPFDISFENFGNTAWINRRALLSSYVCLNDSLESHSIKYLDYTYLSL